MLLVGSFPCLDPGVERRRLAGVVAEPVLPENVVRPNVTR